MRISVIGVGYVGLVSAAGLAHLGHSVVCIDIDKNKVKLINQGTSPLQEDGLDDLLAEHVRNDGRLKASSGYEEIPGTEISLICVGTPSNSDGSINLNYIKRAVKRIGTALRRKNGHHTVVIRSTVIPGTTRDLIIPLLEKHSGRKVGDGLSVSYNPEFLQEGKAVRAFFHPDRIIIGEADEKAGDIVSEIYEDITAPVVRTDITTAEMIKYASNAFLATKISFINEIGNICEKVGVDVYSVAQGISFDYRIGDRFLNAGIGFGGSCLPKDVKALVSASTTKLGYPAPLLRAVLDINEAQALKIVEIAERKLGDLDGKKVSVLGLAFKPNTDDVRNAPALRVIAVLLEKGARIRAYDPKAIANARRALPRRIKYCDSAKEAIDDSDCVLITTEWDEFRDENLYRGKTVIDGRRALDPLKARAICDYQGVCW